MFATMLSLVLSNIAYLVLHVTTNTGSFPKALSAAKEREYLERYKAGDMEARQKLIEHNLRLVAHIIKKYYSNANDQDDLISIGTIGLIKAVSSFNGSKGTRLATYAARCIENEILMYFRSLKKSSQDVFISDPIDTDKDGNVLTLLDVIADDSSIIDDIDTKIKIDRLGKYINDALSPRERLIIELRFGLGGRQPLTQREVAQKLKISRSYVSRLEKKALSDLYDCFNKQG